MRACELLTADKTEDKRRLLTAADGLRLRLDDKGLLRSSHGFQTRVSGLFDAPRKLSMVELALDALELYRYDHLGSSHGIRLARQLAGRRVDSQPRRSSLHFK